MTRRRKKDAVQGGGKMKFVGEWRDDETKRVTRAVLWKAYMDLNEVKVQANTTRLKISPTRWEREYGEFLRSTWEQESSGGDPLGKEVIYSMTTVFCRAEYIGETTITRLKRMKTHVVKSLKKGKQLVCKFLRKVGVHRGIWTTVKAWRVKTTKVMRLKAEGRMMWIRGASLNNVGMSSGGADFKDRRGVMVFGARRRFRYVMRFTTKRTEAREAEKEKERKMEERVREKSNGAKKWKSDFHWTAKLARRPWTKKKSWELAKMKVVQEVKMMDAKRLKHLVGMVYRVLDQTGQSLASKNLKRILRGRKDFRWVELKVRAAAVDDKSVQKTIVQDVKRWANEMERRHGVVMAVRMTMVACATESIFTTMNNTGTEAKKKKEEHQCHCHTEEAMNLRKVGGHVLAPLMSTMATEIEFPKGWSAKSRCRPSWESQKASLEEQFEKVSERVAKTIGVEEKKTRMKIRWPKIEDRFARGGGDPGKQLEEKDLEEWRWRLRNFIRSPIDKYPGEMAVI